MIVEPPLGISTPPTPGQCRDGVLDVMWACVCLVGLGRFLAVTHEADACVDLTNDLWPRAVHYWLHCVPKSSAAECERIGSSMEVCPVRPKVNTCSLTHKSFVHWDGRLRWEMAGLRILRVFLSTVANLGLDMEWSCRLLFMMSFFVGVS